MSYIFPFAFVVNLLSMTAMLIFLSVVGESQMAADFAIVQAATAALFFAFSGNARNVVLATSNPTLAKSLFNIRVILLVPLVLASFWLSSTLGGIEPILAGLLILRRAIEWFGEVVISEKERLGAKNFALVYTLLQIALFIFAVLWFLLKLPFPLMGLFFWALLPMLFIAKFTWGALGDFANSMACVNKKIAPHFGSSFAIGVSLYIFRILMVWMLGKSVSGDLFAAFAMGGVLGSLTLGAFGPSIAFKEKINGISKLPQILTFILWLFLCVGGLILSISYLEPYLFLWTGKDIFFWKAVGFSMIGGVVMTHAQLLRNRLLIHNESHDLFGPDLLMNILIIAAIPVAYFTIGIDGVAGLSLVGALSAFIFYKSSEHAEILESRNSRISFKYISFFVAMAILLPIFVRLNSGLFIDKEVLLTGGRSLLALPLPLSIFLTYIAILMIGSYRSAHLSLSVIFFTFMMMIFATLIVPVYQEEAQRSKILLILQYTLPMGALVLGEMFKFKRLDSDSGIERAFLAVLGVIVPLQLVASWTQGNFQLTGYVYFFSIYQHVEYVPCVLVSAFLFGLYGLWQDSRCRKILMVLSPLMGVYVAASLSPIAIVFLMLGLLVFAVFRWFQNYEKQPIVLFVVTLTVGTVYICIEEYVLQGLVLSIFVDAAWAILSSWQFYIAEFTESIQSIILGCSDIRGNTHISGAHNYYLDVMHNFGVISLLPVLFLFGNTLRLIYMARVNIWESSGLVGHVFVLLFLLVIVNSTQVSLRQPYSAIFIYFIWGVLMARISKINRLDYSHNNALK